MEPDLQPTFSTADRVLRALEHAIEPVTSTQLATQLDLRASMVRHHIRRLHERGVVIEVVRDAPAAVRGRPARMWRLRPVADERAIARIAAELARSRHDDEPALERRMRTLGRSIVAARSDTDDLDALHTGLTTLGFAPRRAAGRPGHEHITLDACPFASPDRGIEDTAICHVHQLIVEGMCASHRSLRQLDIDPSGTGCVIHLKPAQHAPGDVSAH